MALSDIIDRLKARLGGAASEATTSGQDATSKPGAIDEGDPTRTIVSNDPQTPTDHAV